MPPRGPGGQNPPLQLLQPLFIGPVAQAQLQVSDLSPSLPRLVATSPSISWPTAAKWTGISVNITAGDVAQPQGKGGGAAAQHKP